MPGVVQMALEQHELQALADKKSTAGNDRTILAGLAQAALKAEAVTGDPAWDTYVSYIQRALNVARERRQAAMEQVSSPRLVNPDQIAAIRNQILLCDERIRVLEIVVNMPAEIKRVGSVAKEKLKLLDVEEASAEVPDAA